MRLAVVSPFLDRQHGTERCIVEQIERLAFQYGWRIQVFSQNVDQVRGVQRSAPIAEQAGGTIVWHKVSDIPGPHLVKYLWWFVVNHLSRLGNRWIGKAKTDLTYSPGINCFDADVIVVHIVFHELFSRLSSELQLRHAPLKSWHLVIHRRLYYRVAMLLEKKIYRHPRVRLVAVSSLVASQLKSHFGRTDVIVIPNAVDALLFAPDERLKRRCTIRKSFGYLDDNFVLLLIGNDWRKKGLDSLLQALTLISELPVRLLVVGSDDPHFYQQRVSDILSRHIVRFENPSPDVLSFYAAADAYVGPSLEDAFGLPILEAMACGLPVIASIYAGASEFIRDGETGLILSDPRDPSQIARLVYRLYKDGSLRKRMGIAASHYVEANCSWDQNASKTRDFLEKILRDFRRS